jgi:hypothetical protein
MKTKLSLLSLAVLLVALPTRAEKLPGPLFNNLGDLHHPVTTQSKPAQRYFDQGVRLMFGFNHKEAIRSFRSAAHLDPNCAMAHWGVAYAAGPHVNKPMDASDTTNAWAALQLALANQARVPPKEQAYIAALTKRYQAHHVDDRSALDKAFAAAMRDLVKQYPDDLDAQVIFAESLMNTMPWDYWTRDRTPKPETEEILAALRLFVAQPESSRRESFLHSRCRGRAESRAGLGSGGSVVALCAGGGASRPHARAHLHARRPVSRCGHGQRTRGEG